jgi:hypothetical protein
MDGHQILQNATGVPKIAVRGGLWRAIEIVNIFNLAKGFKNTP